MTEETEKPADTDAKTEEIETIDIDALYKQLEKWQAALRFNKNLQSNYAQEITNWRTLRDQLKDEIKAIREEAFEEKAVRDGINAEVAQLKEDRAAANTQIATLKQKRNDAWEQVKIIRNQIREIINRQRSAREHLKPIYPMMKRIEEIDWTVMTKSMPFEQEEVLMDELERILSEISKRRQSIDFDRTLFDFEDAKKQIDEFREAAQQYHELMIQTVDDGEKIHETILNIVKKSEPHHQAMQELFSKIDEMQKEEETAHENMVENIREMELLLKGQDEIYKELRALEKKLTYFKKLKAMEKSKAKAAREEKILDTKVEEALTKYKSGKKLTIHEFTLLMKKGLIKNE